jgi:putative membrane protein
MSGGWLHAKLTLVVVLLVYYIFCGRWLKRGYAALPSATTLRLVNELPVVVVLGIIYLVIAKPF